MTEQSDRQFTPCDEAVRRPRKASGAGLGVLVRSAFGGGRVAFVVSLWVDAVVFGAAAAATAVAVWRQDPGAQVAAPSATRVAVHSPRYAAARWAGRPEAGKTPTPAPGALRR